MSTWTCTVYLYDEPVFVLSPAGSSATRRQVWRAKLPPADVRKQYVRGPGCVRFAS